MMLLTSLALAGDYDRSLYDALREKAVYREAYASIMLKAVFLDDEMRSAQAEKLEAMGGSAPAADTAITVAFGAYSHWRKEMKVSGDASTPWVARAWNGDRACTLLDIVQTKQPSAWDRALYPFLTNWDTLWTARFDPSCGTDSLRFSVQGPRGSVEVSW